MGWSALSKEHPDPCDHNTTPMNSVRTEFAPMVCHHRPRSEAGEVTHDARDCADDGLGLAARSARDSRGASSKNRSGRLERGARSEAGNVIQIGTDNSGKALGLRKHLGENKKDLHNKRQLQLIESKIRRLVKYYIGSRKLQKDFIYKPENAEILLSR